MRKVTASLILLLLSCLMSGAVSHPFFTRYTDGDGLMDYNITHCCQDAFGRIWVSTSGGVYFYTGNKFTPFRDEDYLASCAKTTTGVAAAPDGSIWIASTSGIGYYNVHTGHFTAIPELKTEQIRDIDIEPEGGLWLTSYNGIWHIDEKGDAPQKVVSSNNFSPLNTCLLTNGDLVFTTREGDIYYLDHLTEGTSLLKRASVDASGNTAKYELVERGRQGTVLVSTNTRKLLTLDVYTGAETPILSTSTSEYITEISCLMVRSGEIWIGTRSGLLIYNISTHEIENQVSSQAKQFFMNGIYIRCLFSDANGNVWAGTYNEGLCGWMNYRGHFNRYTRDMFNPNMSGRSIHSLCFDAEGRLWLGSEEGRLNRYDSRLDSFQDFTKQSEIRGGTVISSITSVGNRLWITIYGDGLMVVDPDTGKPVKRIHFPEDECMYYIRTRAGENYAGVIGGLFRISEDAESAQPIPALSGRTVSFMLEDGFGRLWLSLFGRGLGLYDPATDSFRMAVSTGDGRGLTSDAVNCLTLGEDGTIWAGTAGGGLCRIRLKPNGEIDEIRSIRQSDGLPSDNISAVIEDGRGKLWVTTANGVACVDLNSLSVIGAYLQQDKVVGSLFGSGAAARAKDGTIFLGTRNGMVALNPEGFTNLFESKSVIINNVTTGTLDVRQPQPEEGRSAISSGTIRIRQQDAPVLTLSYSTMIYDNPNTLRYECTLRKRGFSNTVVTASNHVSYMALRPGTYDFKVRIEGVTGEENESHRKIIITAPWYRSVLAQILYLILLLCAAWYGLRAYLRNVNEHNQRKEELHEAQRQKDAFKDKMDFMANITHEIRTPVSLIAILVDKLMAKGPGEDGHEELKSLKNSSNRLVELCNELLNFRRIQNNSSYVLKADEDLCRLVRDDLEPFKAAAEQKGLRLSISIPGQPIHVQCDQHAVDCIISNLLSNAIKYGQSRIDCRLVREDGKAVFRVDSDGTRIPEEESELIFNAFYQSHTIASSGSGLGLTYSRTLAELHNGLLYLDTQQKELNSFVFVLPITESSPKVSTEEPKAETRPVLPEEPPVSLDGRARILVVEDNEELRNLIRDELLKDYSVMTAANGQEAFDIVKSNNIDMVISDIMMPIMDGCELCNLIKNNVSYSHILVILLTAAIGVETHLRSLKAGVDSYIEKPFKIEVLKATIGNLFKNREIQNEQFNSNPLAWLSGTSISTVEREFMEKLHSIVLEHISETEMTTPQLASMMMISRQTLAAKVRANTGLSTLEYIRICRLKKAAELLAERKYRISEVAYLVGYTSPSYFTKHFQQQFNMTPSEFINSSKQ